MSARVGSSGATPAVGAPTTRAPAWLAWVLVGSVVLVFGASLRFGFLTWDDNINVTENPHVLDAGTTGLAALWSEPYAGLYVPLASTWFWTLTQISRTGPLAPPDPVWFHAGNVALHALGAWLLFRVVRRLVADERAAFLAALVVVVHPLLVEAVAWISEARGLLASVLSLAALDLAFAATDGERRSWPRTLLATLAFLLALLAKPAVVVLPALLVIFDRFGRGRAWRDAWRLPAVWSLASIGVVIVTKSAQSDDTLRHVPTLLERPIVALDALGFYLVKLVAPFGLAIDYGRSPAWLTEDLSRAWPALVAVAAAALVLFLSAARRWRAPALAFAVALSPVLGLVPFVYQDISTVADRYVVPALPAVAWALAVGFAQILASCGARAWVGAGLLTVALGVASVVQLPTWKDDAALFTRALAVNPRSFKAEGNLALAATRAGRTDEAIERYERALEYGGSRWIVHQNLAVALSQAGRKAESEAHLARSFELRRENVRVASMLGSTRLELRRYAEAIEPLTVAARLAPGDPVVAEWLGAALLLSDRPDAAAVELRRALGLRDTPGVRTNLAQALILAGDVRGAIEQYRALVAAGAAGPDVELNLAWLLATAHDDTLRDGPGALAIAERRNADASQRSPRSLDVWAAALACVGRHAEAEARAREALALADAPGANVDPIQRAAYEEHRAAYAAGRAWRAPEPR